jgi:hypothetical protein
MAWDKLILKMIHNGKMKNTMSHKVGRIPKKNLGSLILLYNVRILLGFIKSEKIGGNL